MAGATNILQKRFRNDHKTLVLRNRGDKCYSLHVSLVSYLGVQNNSPGLVAPQYCESVPGRLSDGVHFENLNSMHT
ncbi:hypothetical protein [Pedobacter terrae]|uniref:hypothetical protein n=1 Tax=Pedobacter terrae TaxID=405671 RepID=UPI002FFB0C4C